MATSREATRQDVLPLMPPRPRQLQLHLLLTNAPHNNSVEVMSTPPLSTITSCETGQFIAAAAVASSVDTSSANERQPPPSSSPLGPAHGELFEDCDYDGGDEDVEGAEDDEDASSLAASSVDGVEWPNRSGASYEQYVSDSDCSSSGSSSMPSLSDLSDPSIGMDPLIDDAVHDSDEDESRGEGHNAAATSNDRVASLHRADIPESQNDHETDPAVSAASSAPLHASSSEGSDSEDSEGDGEDGEDGEGGEGGEGGEDSEGDGEDGSLVPSGYRPVGRERDVLCRWKLSHIRTGAELEQLGRGGFGKSFVLFTPFLLDDGLVLVLFLLVATLLCQSLGLEHVPA